MLGNFKFFARTDEYRPVGNFIGYDDMNKRQKKQADAEHEKISEQIMRDGSEFAMQIGLWSEKEDYLVLKKERAKKIKEQQRIRTREEGIDEELSEEVEGCIATIVETEDGNIIFSVIVPPRRFTRKDLLDRCITMNSTTFNSAEVYLTNKELKTLLAYNKENGFVATLNPTLSILFRKEARPDPLDEVWKLETAEDVEYDLDTMSFYTAVKEDGSKFAVPFKDNSGYIVAGLPGSGKSASFLPLLASMVYRNSVELTVIDGKGSDNELDYFGDYGLADVYKFNVIDGKGNYEEIYEVIKDFKEKAEERAKKFKKKYGESNYWNIPIEKRPKLKMLVIDECQEFFEKEGETDIDVKQMKDKIIGLATDIVRRKRDAGAMICLVTQRPSAETIPTKISSNSGLKLSLRLNDSVSERMALGDDPSNYERKYRASEIPTNMQGLAVTRSGEGGNGRERVRFANYGANELIRDLEKVNKQRLEEIIKE